MNSSDNRRTDADEAGRAKPPLSKSAYVFEELSKAIRNGDLPPGSTINQEKVAAKLGVSSTPVREALRTLEARGLIIYIAHRGATVATLEPNEETDLYLLRANVEGLAVHLATERCSDDQLAAIARHHTDLALKVESGSSDNLATLNRGLHFAMYEGADSQLLLSHIKDLWTMSSPDSKKPYWTRGPGPKEFISEHQDIVDAMQARDSDLAESRMRDHIARVATLRLNKDRESWSDDLAKD